MAIINSEDVLLDRIYVNSTSFGKVDRSPGSFAPARALYLRALNPASFQAPARNTDGVDTFYSNHITFRNWTITGGDDNISLKANSTNILIQDSGFHGGLGVAIGFDQLNFPYF